MDSLPWKISYGPTNLLLWCKYSHCFPLLVFDRFAIFKKIGSLFINVSYK